MPKIKAAAASQFPKPAGAKSGARTLPIFPMTLSWLAYSTPGGKGEAP